MKEISPATRHSFSFQFLIRVSCAPWQTLLQRAKCAKAHPDTTHSCCALETLPDSGQGCEHPYHPKKQIHLPRKERTFSKSNRGGNRVKEKKIKNCAHGVRVPENLVMESARRKPGDSILRLWRPRVAYPSEDWRL